MTQYDYIIIGAGPGGYTLAGRLAARGHQVALIERDSLGGTCLNRGCIPTKCLCATADAAMTVSHAADFGVDCGQVSIDYAKAHQRMRSVVAQLTEGVERAVGKATLYRGEAKLAQPGSIPCVYVGDEVLCAPNIVIATGSAPARLPIPGAELAMTSDEFLNMDRLPESAVIIGGGVIGIEFASILAALGCQVTVVEYLPEILPVLDADVAKRLRSMLSRRGIKFVLGAKVTEITNSTVSQSSVATAWPPALTVSYEAKRGAAEVTADCVLMAVGRKPVVPEGCAEVGIDLDHRGCIVVDDRMRTSIDGVYAIGDVNGRCMLAHAAEAQAAVILGHDVDMELMPSAVFCKPEAASVGMGEDECRRRGIDCRVYRSNYAANGKALSMGEPDGIVKLTADPDSGRLLGAQVIGAHAADLIAEATALLRAGATVHDLAHGIITAHPTLSEVLKAAGEG